MRSAAARISAKSAGSAEADMSTAVSSGRSVSQVASLFARISRTCTGSAGFSAISAMHRAIRASSMKCRPPGRYLSISDWTMKFFR